MLKKKKHAMVTFSRNAQQEKKLKKKSNKNKKYKKS